MSSSLTSTVVDAAALADELARARVIDADRLAGLLTAFPGGGPAELADYLVARGVLTPFQADRAAAGLVGGLVVGPYLLTGVHRGGVLGPLFRAADRTRPGEFAVRVLPLRSLWRLRQAKQRVRALAALPAHPAIVPLVAADSAAGFQYFAWPFAPGPSLADRVETGGPLSPAEAAALLVRLADGLAACHARGVVHGAVCPQAVVAPAGGFPRLLEVGVGALLAEDLAGADALFDTLSAAVAAAGVLDFAAPELVADPARPTPAADQFALGAVGYFALTGEVPFPGETLTDRLHARTTGVVNPVATLNPEVPPGLAAVIDLMLGVDPADRFGSLDEVRDELTAVAATLPPEPDPAPYPPMSYDGGPVPASKTSGAISWAAAARAGSGATPLPTRDDSDASVSFDLPAPTAEPVVVADRGPRSPMSPVDTPSRAVCETQPSSASQPLPPLVTPGSGVGRRANPPPSADVPTEAKPGGPALPGLNKSRLLGALASPGAMPPPPKLPTSGSRLAIPTPVQWHTTAPAEPEPLAEAVEDPTDGAAPPSVTWKALKRNLLFWQTPRDHVQVSVFGPPALTPGQTARVAVVAHAPDAADSVRTLARAFDQQAELLGSGVLAKEVTRGAGLAVHVSVTNAGVARSLVPFVWRGQPQRLAFDLHVPWESPGGAAPGLVSVGLDNVRIGKAEFRLHILPRKG